MNTLLRLEWDWWVVWLLGYCLTPSSRFHNSRRKTMLEIFLLLLLGGVVLVLAVLIAIHILKD
jgi:hypothetical protein